MSNNVGLSSPWVAYARKIYALFEQDSDIRCVWDDENVCLKIYVDDALKADALDQLLPPVKQFGNVTMTIEVIAANEEVSLISLYKAAFAGNPIVSYIETVDGFGNPLNYIVFEKEVVQYFNDNLGDIHGIESTLYQDLAEEVFDEHDSIFFCTDIEDGLSFGTPLGEWP